MQLLPLCLCVVMSTTQAQFLGTNLLQQIPGFSSLPLLNSPIGQQFLQGLQSISSFQQGHGSGSQLQDFNGQPQQKYGSQSNFNNGPTQMNGPPGRHGVGGQQGGLQQSGFGVSQQSNERPGFNSHPPPPPPFGGQQQRPGFGNNQQQQQGLNRPPSPQQQIGKPQQQQNFAQQSRYGGAQSQGYTGSVQDYSYNFEQNNQGSHPSSSNYDKIHSNEGQDNQVGYQQYNNFYNYGNNDDQEDHHIDDTDNNQNKYQDYNNLFQFGNNGEQENHHNDDTDNNQYEYQDYTFYPFENSGEQVDHNNYEKYEELEEDGL